MRSNVFRELHWLTDEDLQHIINKGCQPLDVRLAAARELEERAELERGIDPQRVWKGEEA